MKSNLQKEVILITETNFVLDIVFEQSKECERLLAVIHKQNIKLVISEYAFAEAEGTIVNIIQNRITSIDSALDALRQASRSAYHALDDFITQYLSLLELTKTQVWKCSFLPETVMILIFHIYKKNFYLLMLRFSFLPVTVSKDL